MTRLLGIAERYEQSFCLAVIDIDQFKQINDRFGHAMGDRLLRQFGACLRDAFRQEDVIGRWGGEEFVIGLYGVEETEVKQYFKKLSESWQQVCEAHENSHLTITFSTGLAAYSTADSREARDF